MKIVGFEGNGGLHLGVVEGDAVIDLQAGDVTLLGNMMFPVAETIAYVTQGLTLEPGDIVFTGTPSGVGHARKPNPVWMKPGDICEIDIERIGVLVNPIAAEH